MKRMYVIAGVAVAVGLAALLLVKGRGQASPAAQAAGPVRIVSLAPSVTEMLYAIGAQDQIVGTADYSDFPPQAAAIPKIGSLGAPNVERVLSLRPTVAIGTGSEDTDGVRALAGYGVKVVIIPVRNIQEMIDGFETIGREAGAQAKAAEVARSLRQRLTTISDRFREVPVARRPKVYVEIWGEPITTVGGSSFIDDMVAHAGGVNVAHELTEAYPTVSPEKIIEWNPDAMLLCGMTQQGQGLEVVRRRIGWAGIAAVKSARVFSDITPDLIVRPGPRALDGLEALVERLYGRSATTAATKPENP